MNEFEQRLRDIQLKVMELTQLDYSDRWTRWNEITFWSVLAAMVAAAIKVYL